MKLLLLYVDAWPFRYKDILVNELDIMDNPGISRLIPVYGFTDCFKTTLISGLYPVNHGYWVSYRFSDKKVNRPLPEFTSSFFDRSSLIARGSRFILNRFLHNHLFQVKSWGHIRTGGISSEAPIEKIDRYLRSRGFETLFSLMDKSSISYTILEDRFYEHSLGRFFKEIQNKGRGVDVVFGYIDEPDFWGHRYGTEDPRYLKLIRWLARLLKLFIKMISTMGVSYLIFSDHGMTTVNKFLNVYDMFPGDPMYGNEYVVGIDATFLRIFYLDREPVKSPVLDRIRKIVYKYGYKLGEEEYSKYKLPLTRDYGDEVYALKEGAVFFPNFFSWLKPYGMHAYSPDYPSQHGVVVASNDINIKKENLDVVELSSIIRRFISAL
ncbi:MAG: alkaline phosphatase family protein [Desulfurococcales archaeon]|nr:alkaline phosphatase family protein [Desulfurococcales archaeon]